MSEILTASGFTPYKMNLSQLDPSKVKSWPIMDMMWIHANTKEELILKILKTL